MDLALQNRKLVSQGHDFEQEFPFAAHLIMVGDVLSRRVNGPEKEHVTQPGHVLTQNIEDLTSYRRLSPAFPRGMVMDGSAWNAILV